MSSLKCPCCNSALKIEGKAYVCSKGHSFDIAKKGYVNLILANQGRAGEEGDSKEMIEARKRFLESGHYSILRDSLCEIVSMLPYQEEKVSFADIACGEGYYTNAIHKNSQQTLQIHTIGLDISKSAIQSSSTMRNMMGLKNIEYVIGNMDYLPLFDSSMDVILNCFAPINESEFLRVVKGGGYYIRVLPDIYHLYELKEFLYENVRLNEPKEKTIEGFELVEERAVSSVETLNNQEIQDLFTMTPYYYKTSKEAKEKLASLNELKLRISFSIRIYKKS